MTIFLRKQERGFTLIELLVVIAIIGMLSSVILASLNSARSKSRDARRVQEIKQIQIALALYFDSCSKYPSNIYSAASACTGGLAPTYMPKVPQDPTGSTACTDGTQSTCYKYAAVGSGASNVTSYHLAAYLEDSSHPALGVDSDNAGTAGTVTNSPIVNFHGNATNCAGTTAASPDQCYDLVP